MRGMILFGFLMKRMLAAEWAEFHQSQPLAQFSLILAGKIIGLFALATLHFDHGVLGHTIEKS